MDGYFGTTKALKISHAYRKVEENLDEGNQGNT